MAGVSDPFLSALRKLYAACEGVAHTWTVFWTRYQEICRRQGLWFPDVGPKWAAFQSAFQEAARQLQECRQAMPKPEELPPLFTGWPRSCTIAQTFSQLLGFYAKSFAAWLPGVMNPPGGFGQWNSNTDFSREFMEPFEGQFIVPLGHAIEVYERFLAQREAQRLAEALAADPPTVLEGDETPQGPSAPQSTAMPPGEATPQKPEPDFCFRRDGDGWFIRAFGKEGHFKNRKGFHYIALLIERAGKPVPMAEFIAKAEGHSPDPKRTPLAESWQPVLDREAKQSLKDHLVKLTADIKQAEERGDFTSADVLRKEFERLSGYLLADTQPNGKAKSFSTTSKRMAEAVRKAISRVCDALRQSGFDKLADHFEAYISAEEFSYVYRPPASVTWALL
ncbi:MAG: hypothetical protein H5U08_08940 [Thermogutta sp.]|uniref:hypothetical protein n=1 Tax=Thermogutta sp. TaxID=1962930 RepID=UPI00198BAA9B|nr:hypothetical protein [Thermogutta sp.]MBC7352469.1 hypothetical protein [Thermogutta sp.]